MPYHLCAAGTTLRNQINKTFPKRDKKSDGWIGDTRHLTAARQGKPSDHNPDMKAGGVVRAIDIDADLDTTLSDHALAEALADQLRQAALAGEKRLGYIIFQSRICSPRDNWKWRAYQGDSPHNHHIHVSFLPAGDTDGASFKLPLLTAPKAAK